MFDWLHRLFGQLFDQPAQPPTPPITTGTPEPAPETVISAWERERELRRHARTERRLAAKQRDRTTFGEETWGVSATHRAAATNPERLARYNLPVLQDEIELAVWLDISLEQLRWFTHDRAADTVWHYVRYSVPKRSGGSRTILAPKRQLKAAQRRVLYGIINRVPPTEAAHGFTAFRSTRTNAEPHVGQQVVVNIDLQDFFPTITYPRVRGIFIQLGYSYSVASTLALLCTEHDRVIYERDGQPYFVSVTPRALPQGAPTSPALANLAAAKLDRRLIGLSKARGWNYTRYADDITFSGNNPAAIGRVLGASKRIIAEEQFNVHPRKLRVVRRAGRQTVTGLVVNDVVGTPRALRRELRAILHNAQTTGLLAQNRIEHPNFREYVAGMIGHVTAANPEQGSKLREMLHHVRD